MLGLKEEQVVELSGDHSKYEVKVLNMDTDSDFFSLLLNIVSVDFLASDRDWNLFKIFSFSSLQIYFESSSRNKTLKAGSM